MFITPYFDLVGGCNVMIAGEGVSAHTFLSSPFFPELPYPFSCSVTLAWFQACHLGGGGGLVTGRRNNFFLLVTHLLLLKERGDGAEIRAGGGGH